MSFLLAFGSIAAAAILWRFVRKASALSNPPRWVSDEAVFMVIAPLVTLLGALGLATMISGLVHVDAMLAEGGFLSFGIESLLLLAVFAALWRASAPTHGGALAPTGEQLIDAGKAVAEIASPEAGAANDPRTPPGRSPRRAA